MRFKIIIGRRQGQIIKGKVVVPENEAGLRKSGLELQAGGGGGGGKV